MNHRAAIYLRISQDPRQDGLAVERQRGDCERIVREHPDWSLVATYQDTVSAFDRKKKRPHYEQMLADYEAGRFDVLVAWDLDRLTRQPRQLEDWIERAEERGLILVTANGEADLTTDSGRMFARIKASVARNEIERKSARQLAKNRQNVELGRPVPGRRRYGYESDGITPRVSEAEVVRTMFRHVASGGSLRSLAERLKRDGVDPAPGKSWSTRRVRDILTNPHYFGTARHKGQDVPASQVVPIVDAATAREVRALLRDPSRRTTPGQQVRHLSSGIATCSECGEPMLYMRAYRCKASAAHPSITKDRLDGRVRREVALAFLTGGADLFPRSEGGLTVAAILAEHDRNLAAVRAITSDRDEGLVPPSVARARLIELREARERIEADLERTRAEKGAAGVLTEIAQALLDGATSWSTQDFEALVEEVAARFDSLELEKRRELVRALLNVEVRPGRDARRVVVEHLRALHLNPWAPDHDAELCDSSLEGSGAQARWSVAALDLDPASAAVLQAERIVREAATPPAAGHGSVTI